MRVDRGVEKDRLDLAREEAWDKFSPFLAHLREGQETYRKQVEIPYEAFYAFEEVLATFGDQPGRPDSFLASFERLTTYLTNGKITRFKPLLEPERLRLRSLFIRLPKRSADAPQPVEHPLLAHPNFTGRESILALLEGALASGAPAALLQAIIGLGGVGKTQTAVEYAYRHRDQYRAVLWVRADTETNLISGYRELAEVLDLPKKDARDSEVVAGVRRWLGREPGYLLILDNADDPALVKPFLPPDPRGHILITSRAHNFDVLGVRKPIDLPVLTPDEALEFLVKRRAARGHSTPPSWTRRGPSPRSWTTCRWRWSTPPPTWSRTRRRSPSIWTPTAPCG